LIVFRIFTRHRLQRVALSILFLGVVSALMLVRATDLLAQETELPDRVARGSLRPYWHVFAAYAVAWLILFGWVVSIARRFARLDLSRDGGN
jgi:hypothetical protein